MGVCCLFSEHLFLRAPMESCFYQANIPFPKKRKSKGFLVLFYKAKKSKVDWFVYDWFLYESNIDLIWIKVSHCVLNMRCFAGFGTICAIWKTWKIAMENSYFYPPWVLFTFFKLYKWYQILQNISYINNDALDFGNKYVINVTC